MSHVHAYILFIFLILNLCLLSLSLSDRLRYGTQIVQIYFGLEPTSRFWVILFLSFCTLSYSVLWWEGQDGLLWELLEMWRSFGTPSYSVELCWHSSPRSHLDLGLGFSTWGTLEMSHRVYIGVLLQHTWQWYLCALFCYHIPRYTYSSYFESYIWGITRS